MTSVLLKYAIWLHVIWIWILKACTALSNACKGLFRLHSKFSNHMRFFVWNSHANVSNAILTCSQFLFYCERSHANHYPRLEAANRAAALENKGTKVARAIKRRPISLAELTIEICVNKFEVWMAGVWDSEFANRIRFANRAWNGNGP